MPDFKLPEKETMMEKIARENRERKEKELRELSLGKEIKGDERPPAQGLSKAVDESYDKVTVAMAGRLESDIPLNDPYWTVKNDEVMKWNLTRDLAEKAMYLPPPNTALPVMRAGSPPPELTVKEILREEDKKREEESLKREQETRRKEEEERSGNRESPRIS